MQSRFIILTFIICCVMSATGQRRSAIKIYDKASNTINKKESIRLLQEAIAKDDTYSEAYLSLANNYKQLGQYNLQVNTLMQASEQCDRKLKLISTKLAQAAYLNGEYTIAQQAINQLDVENSEALVILKNNIEFSIESASHPYPFSAVNLGENINTKHDDYWPSLSIDEQQIVTTVRVEPEDGTTIAQEDLYYSNKNNKKWSTTKPFSKNINTRKNEGAQSLSADGNVMIFTACDRNDGIGSCDLYISYHRNEKWSSPIALPAPLNTKSWEGHPCISADGKKLFFSSDRKGGYGGKDIYIASISLEPSLKVDNIRNLGKKINTSKDEISPFIHPDGKTLYFSSNGHTGLGRQDIYYSKRDSLGFTESPTNFGYPINTHVDEIGLIVNTQGNKGYFATEREDSQRKDIYTFDIPAAAQAKPTTYLQATLKDKIENRSIECKVEVHKISSGELIYQNEKTSGFIIPINIEQDYAIIVESEGYLFYSDNILVNKQEAPPYEKVMALSPINSGEKIILKNVFFKHNSSELDENFSTELEKSIRLIKENPKLQFEVSGHTDDSGSPSYNLLLSEQRAKVVYDYFISHGVASNRLSYKGYGQSRPISSNSDKNRRTELLVK